MYSRQRPSVVPPAGEGGEEGEEVVIRLRREWERKTGRGIHSGLDQRLATSQRSAASR